MKLFANTVESFFYCVSEPLFNSLLDYHMHYFGVGLIIPIFKIQYDNSYKKRSGNLLKPTSVEILLLKISNALVFFVLCDFCDGSEIMGSNVPLVSHGGDHDPAQIESKCELTFIFAGNDFCIQDHEAGYKPNAEQDKVIKTTRKTLIAVLSIDPEFCTKWLSRKTIFGRRNKIIPENK